MSVVIPKPKRVRLLGGEVDLAMPRDVVRLIDRTAAEGARVVIATQSARSLLLLRRSAELRAFFAMSDLIQIDSPGLIMWGRLLGLALRPQMRSTYLGWREPFWRLADARAWRVFCLGGAPGIAEAAAARVAADHPHVTIDVHHGGFDASPGSPENESVVGRLRSFDPHVLLVGMGAPRQEIWTLQNAARLERGAIIMVGAAFEHEAGGQPAPERAPRRWSLIGPAVADLGAMMSRAVRS